MEKTASVVIKLHCILCGRAPKNHQEVLEINELGYHLMCDHVQSEVMAERRIQHEE